MKLKQISMMIFYHYQVVYGRNYFMSILEFIVFNQLLGISYVAHCKGAFTSIAKGMGLKPVEA